MTKPEIQITKSWRKSISLSFDKQGALQVRAPKFMLGSQIDNFLLKNSDWIDKNFQKIRERELNKKYYLF
jgi:predicted metal-dependent hydrolase